MKIFKCIIAISFLPLLFILTGCFNQTNQTKPNYEYSENNNENEADNMVELNERQISICEENNLPTDYNLLNAEQKKSIKRIEELLQYLDSKYKKHFNYVGYSDGGLLEDEWLEAYPDEMNEYYAAKVTVDESGEITDDYCEVIASILLADDLQNFLNTNCGNSFKVFAYDCRLSDNYVVDSVDELSGKAGATFTIFVKGKNHTDDLNSYAQELTKWYEEKNIYGYANFIMLSDEYFDSVTIANYGRAKLEDKTEISLSCDRTKDGQMKIY